MCGTHDSEDGHGHRQAPVNLHERILSATERRAGLNRHRFREAGVLAINVMGSPASGKTAAQPWIDWLGEREDAAVPETGIAPGAGRTV